MQNDVTYVPRSALINKFSKSILFMCNKVPIALLVLGFLTIGGFLLFKNYTPDIKSVELRGESEKDQDEDDLPSFVTERLKYEFDLLKDPKTGQIPAHIFEQELAFAKTVPLKQYDDNSG